MISFEPLIRQLKEKSISQKKLAEMIGIEECAVSAFTTGRITPNTERLEQICKALECDISDVITWKKEITQHSYKINWNSVFSLIKKSGLTIREASDKMQKGVCYFYQGRQHNSVMSKLDVDNFCSIVKCKQEEIIEIQ